MNLFGKQCPKCGLMQLPAVRCKICGTLMESPVISAKHRPASLRAPNPPHPIEPAGAYSIAHEEPAGSAEPRSLEETGKDSEPVQKIGFHGTAGGLFGIYIRNTLLTIVTLGVYYFWGKARVRRYMVGQTEFLGDRLTFHGTGKEFLTGFIKAFLIFALPVGLLNSAPEIMKLGLGYEIAAMALTSLAVLLFIPLAMVSSFRYRLTRTSWREIRFSFWGKTTRFIGLFIFGSILTSLTLGLYYPFFMTRKYGYMVSHVHFGNQSFRFNGKGRDLFWAFLKALLLTLPTLGISWIWFLAKRQRYFWEHTSFGNTCFQSTVAGRSYFNLLMGNLLLLIFTVGLAWPWVKIRNARYILDHLYVVGPLDLEGIQQSAQASTATGEGLAGFLNVDFNLG